MNHRVLRVITRLNVGGPARHALLLSKELASTWPTRLIAGIPPASEGELSDPDVTVDRLRLVRPISPADDLSALRGLRRELTSHRPAIVHSHMAKAGMLARLSARLVRPRPTTIHTFHGHVLDGYFPRYVEASFLAMERALARRTDALVAVSEETRDSLLGMGIGQPQQWRVIPLGLDLDAHFRSARTGALRDELGLADDVLLVGLVGRLAPIKDPLTMLEAFARVDGAHLAVVGDGELRVQTAARAATLGIDSRVHFTGWKLDMPAVLADLDLIALSSRNEGTPLALIEAAACGVPAVATDVGGVRAVVDDGTTGLLVPPGDVSAIATAIAELLGDDQRRRDMGVAARARATRFTASRLVADISALYESLVGQT